MSLEQIAANYIDPVLRHSAQRAAPAPKSEPIAIGSHLYPSDLVQEFSELAPCSLAFYFAGKPGVGKTQFATSAAAEILSTLSGGPRYQVILSEPYLLKNPSDLFCSPSFVHGNLVWQTSHIVAGVEKASHAGCPLVIVFDELNRAADVSFQAPVLDVANNGVIWVEQMGRHFPLPRHSRIILTGNTAGVGIHPIIEPLLDRAARIQFALPHAEALARMILHELEREESDGRLSFFSPGKKHFGLAAQHRSLALRQLEILCQAAIQVDRFSGENAGVSLRKVLQVCRRLATGDLTRAIDFAVRILTAHLGEETQARTMTSQIRFELESAFSHGGYS